MMKKSCCMASVDLTEAYHSVPIAGHHRKFLNITWEEQLYHYRALSFGLCSDQKFSRSC